MSHKHTFYLGGHSLKSDIGGIVKEIPETDIFGKRPKRKLTEHS